MSENNTPVAVDVVDAVEIPVIKVTNADEFRAVAKVYGIPVGERGRLPKKNLFDALLPLIIAGKVKFVETEFLSLADARGVIKGERKAKPEISYRITYHTLNKNGKPMPGTTVTLTANEIRSYLPNVKGMVNVAMATMAIALYRAKDGSPLTDLNKYVITGLVKIEDTPGTDEPTANGEADTDAQNGAEDTDSASEGEDTGEAVSDADSDSETPTDEHASEDAINEAIAAGELVNA